MLLPVSPLLRQLERELRPNRDSSSFHAAASASSELCDRSPVATRPSAGYGSSLVTVDLSFAVRPAPTPLCRWFHMRERSLGIVLAGGTLTEWHGCPSVSGVAHACHHVWVGQYAQDLWTRRRSARGIASTTAATRPSAGTGGESVREEVRRHGGTEDPHPAQVV